MKKSDLKTGMIVRAGNGRLYMVLKETGMKDTDTSDNNVLLGITEDGSLIRMGWMGLTDYREDLTCSDSESYDITEVFSTEMAADIGEFLEYRSIWRRDCE